MAALDVSFTCYPDGFAGYGTKVAHNMNPYPVDQRSIRNVSGGAVKFEKSDTGGRPVKDPKTTRIKEVGKKTIADFIRSETGSVGVKNAATIGAFTGALALSQSICDATTDADGNVIVIIIAT